MRHAGGHAAAVPPATDDFLELSHFIMAALLPACLLWGYPASPLLTRVGLSNTALHHFTALLPPAC
jgi:hypothetical protein